MQEKATQQCQVTSNNALRPWHSNADVQEQTNTEKDPPSVRIYLSKGMFVL